MGVTDLRFVRRFVRILIDPGWAPFGVVALHLVLAERGLTHRFDHVLHFLGGASIAYFFFRLFELFSLFPSGRTSSLCAASFTSSCTAAVFWEFAEFTSDTFLRTSVQQSLSETMLDLVFGVFGVMASLALLALWRTFVRRAGP